MRLIFHLIIFLAISSCNTHMKVGDFKILPTPKQFEVSGKSNLKVEDVLHYFSSRSDQLPILGSELSKIKRTESRDEAQIVYSIDPSLDIKAEGYLLTISRNKIHITGKDDAGLLYGFMTLEQLIVDAKEQNALLPICEIKDYPSLDFRSIHLDMKHHLEKTTYYYQMIDKLASYKVNAIIAEVEDKLQFQLRPKAASPDALSIDEWKKLSAYAKARNIEISPLVQGLGHASYVLKHDQFKDLRDDPKSDWAFNPLDPKTYDVQFDLYRDAIAATPHGKYLHIGGDEVHTTGRNSGKSALELQLIWLNKVCQFAEENGRIPIFWDDMPLKHAGVYQPMFDTKLSTEEVDSIWDENGHKLSAFLDQFPKNCIYMRWNYSSPQAYGNERSMEWFTQNGLLVMGATAGQTRWVLMPQNESNIANIRHFAVSSINKGINGLLCTLWDDDSPHFELYWRGIIAFAEYSWAGDVLDIPTFKSVYRHREFSNLLADPSFAFIDDLEKPVEFWNNALLKNNDRRGLVKLENPITDAIIDFPDYNKKGEWSNMYADKLEQAENYLRSADSIQSKIAYMKSVSLRNSFTLEMYEQVNNMTRFSSQALLALKAYDIAETAEESKATLDRIRQLPDEFKTIRAELELVYGQTRKLTKPDNYILDQDHHRHLANQSTTYDWQFYAELLFNEKIGQALEMMPDLNNL